MCQPGYDGVDCSRVIIGTDDCPNDCGGKESPRGLCWLGVLLPRILGCRLYGKCKTTMPGGCSSTDNATSENAFARLVNLRKPAREVKSCPDDCGRGQCTRGRYAKLAIET